jgi:hypothetical protein
VNKKEDLIQKIIDDTNNDKIEWKIESAVDMSKYVVNHQLLIRVFTAEYKNSIIYLTEQKIPNFEEDLGDYYNKLHIDILFIQDNVLKMVINTNDISEYLLDDIYELVKSKCSDDFLDELQK